MFLLKKFVTFWIMPLPFCLTLLVIGVFLLRSSTRAKTGRRFVLLGTLLLLFFSNRSISTWLIRPLEVAYSAAPEATESQALPPKLLACRFVVVLGGGHGDTPDLSAVNKLSTSARGRLAEGVRLVRLLPEAKLVTSGGGEPGQPSHAAVLAQAAISLGVEPERIARLDSPRDTEDESRAIRALVGDQPFALVTSAWHMRRAMGWMKLAGLQAYPCPADYAERPNQKFRISDLGWDTESLGRSTWAVYERIGFLWLKLRGEN